uniref:Uncharacterized protein n=1 Tax=Cacopsylla melanoneura TaxID=428564 RepID=A0A8D8UZN3_9HEMI
MEVVDDQTRLTTATKVEVKNKLNKNYNKNGVRCSVEGFEILVLVILEFGVGRRSRSTRTESFFVFTRYTVAKCTKISLWLKSGYEKSKVRQFLSITLTTRMPVRFALHVFYRFGDIVL